MINTHTHTHTITHTITHTHTHTPQDKGLMVAHQVIFVSYDIFLACSFALYFIYQHHRIGVLWLPTRVCISNLIFSYLISHISYSHTLYSHISYSHMSSYPLRQDNCVPPFLRSSSSGIVARSLLCLYLRK